MTVKHSKLSISKLRKTFKHVIAPDDKGAYVNFINSIGEEELDAAYPASTLEKLRQAKAKYDPTNLFRMNQNISPKKG